MRRRCAWLLLACPPRSAAAGGQGEILIKDGFVATMDRARTVYRRGSVLVRGDTIAAVGADVRATDPAARVIDAGGKVVLPGFVNAHSHLQQYFRGVYEQVGDFFKVNLPLEGYRSPEDMETMANASCAEFLYGGCTTAFVIYTYPDLFAQKAVAIGNRLLLASDIEMVDLQQFARGTYAYNQSKGEAAFQRAVDLHQKWHGSADGRITVAMWPKAPDMVTEAMLTRCGNYAKQHGLRFGTHLSQSFREIAQVAKLQDLTPTSYLHKLGLLNANLTAAHFAYATEADQQLLQASGAAVIQCTFWSSPWLRWRDAGVAVGLGTDDYHHDMLPLMRGVLQGQQTRAQAVQGSEGIAADDRVRFRPTFYDLLEMATRGGAEAIGMGDVVGSLEVGKKADVILVNADTNPFVTPTLDPLASVVQYASGSDVDTVLVGGRVVKRHGVLTTVDARAALAAAQQRSEHIIRRFFADHPDIAAEWHRKVPYMPLPSAQPRDEL